MGRDELGTRFRRPVDTPDVERPRVVRIGRCLRLGLDSTSGQYLGWNTRPGHAVCRRRILWWLNLVFDLHS